MAIPSFTSGQPPDGSSLGGTKANIRNNLDGTFQVFGVDHFSQNNSTPGYHQKSTYPNISGPPTTASGQLALYSKAISSGKSALFMVRDNNTATETQLTSPSIIAPLLDENGYTFLPGGILLQWGIINSTASSYQTLLFATENVNFPNACFNVYCQPYGKSPPSSSQATIQINASTVSKTSFQWAFVTNGSNWTGFSWLAIGN